MKKSEILIEQNENESFNNTQIKFFLSSLYKDFVSYKKNLSENETICEKKYNLVYFIDENNSRKSPITIINAEWGVGKTHFIKELAKYTKNNHPEEIIKKDERNNIEYKFSKMIVINMLNYSSLEDFEEQLLYDLNCIMKNKLKFPESYEKRKKIKGNACEIFSCVNVGCEYAGLNMSWLKRIRINTFKIKNNFNKNYKSDSPVLIFFDNVERISDDGQKFLRIINKFCRLAGFIICVSTNIKKFDKNLNDLFWRSDYELWIQKFVDIPTYTINCAKLPILQKAVKSDELLKVFELLICEIKTNISSRSFKKIIECKHSTIKSNFWCSIGSFLEEFDIRLNENAKNFLYKKICKKMRVFYEEYNGLISDFSIIVEKKLLPLDNFIEDKDRWFYEKEFKGNNSVSYLERTVEMLKIIKAFKNVDEMMRDLSFSDITKNYARKIFDFAVKEFSELSSILSLIEEKFRVFQKEIGVQESNFIWVSNLDNSKMEILAKRMISMWTRN